MRILMAVPNYPFPILGGLERQSHELAKAIIKRGHEVHVVSGRFDPDQKGTELIDGIFVHRIPWAEHRPIRFLFLPFSLIYIICKVGRKMDLIHVHNISWFGAFVTLIAKLFGIPTIAKLPNIGEYGIPGMRKRPFGFLLIWLLKRSNSIIAMTPESMEELAAIGYSQRQVLQVANGISLIPDTERESSPSSGPVRVIFVGRLIEQKGLLDLIHAWSVVRARAKYHIKLRLIGDGPQESELRALVLALGLGESVEFCGFCTDVMTEINKADIFVLPSNAEGNSNAILEAMRAGLPIIATKVGGAQIQVGSPGAPFLVCVGDRDALADRLLELIEDESLRIRLGRAMHGRIESIFAIDQIAGIYERAYDLIRNGRQDHICLIDSEFSKSPEEEERK